MSNLKWVIDPMHSEIQFKVKHLVISTVTGRFNIFSGLLESTIDDDFAGSTVSFEADIDSIDTNNEQRDAHLKSADFFDAENHPKLSFEGKLNGAGGGHQLDGKLTIRGNTKSVSLDVAFGGTMVDPYGNHKAGFEVTGKINRKDFGLTWSAVTEAGGVVVSDDIKLILNIQLVKQA